MKWCLTAFAAALLSIVAFAGIASAAPKGNDNWLVLTAICNGQPVQVLDPPGGNTAFINGRVAVGKEFKFTNLATGEVIQDTLAGKGVSRDRLSYCAFTFNDVPTPDGNVDLLFEVWALPTPQGHH